MSDHAESNESSKEEAEHNDTLETLSTTLKNDHLPLEKLRGALKTIDEGISKINCLSLCRKYYATNYHRS